MNPSNQPAPGPTQLQLAAQLSGELLQLRDALVSLSINLKDWQFELDQQGRNNAQAMLMKTLERLGQQRPPSTGGGEPSPSSASRG